MNNLIFSYTFNWGLEPHQVNNVQCDRDEKNLHSSIIERHKVHKEIQVPRAENH
jgi:hypothetical protein